MRGPTRGRCDQEGICDTPAQMPPPLELLEPAPDFVGRTVRPGSLRPTGLSATRRRGPAAPLAFAGVPLVARRSSTGLESSGLVRSGVLGRTCRIFLLAVVRAVVNDDGYWIYVSGLLLLTSGVWLVRTWWARRDASGRVAEPPSSRRLAPPRLWIATEILMLVGLVVLLVGPAWLGLTMLVVATGGLLLRRTLVSGPKRSTGVGQLPERTTSYAVFRPRPRTRAAAGSSTTTGRAWTSSSVMGAPLCRGGWRRDGPGAVPSSLVGAPAAPAVTGAA
jgi:hypothetical protein